MHIIMQMTLCEIILEVSFTLIKMQISIRVNVNATLYNSFKFNHHFIRVFIFSQNN